MFRVYIVVSSVAESMLVINVSSQYGTWCSFASIYIHLIRPHQTGWPNWISLRSLLDGVHARTHPCSKSGYCTDVSQHL